MSLTRLLARPLLAGVVSYLLLVGATWNGVIIVDFHPLTLGLMVLLAALWGWMHVRGAWRWHETPFDGVLMLWALVIALSMVANPETWRRSVEALWYLLVYTAVGYFLQDALANGALKRGMLVDALMIAGVLVVLLAAVQLRQGLSLDPANYRVPVGSVGNPNAFGALMVVLTPFIWQRTLAARGWLRWTLGFYGLAASLLAIVTFSRGTWLGFGVMVIALIAGLLAANDALRPQRLRQAWRTLSAGRRRLAIACGAGWLLLGGAGLAWSVNALNDPGRSLRWRLENWSSALDQFAAQPLTGNGLFTYGRYFVLRAPVPPGQPHSHAHSLPLNVAAELGLFGLLALSVTAGVMAWAFWRNWRAADASQRLLLAAGLAAVLGFSAHHLVDTPAMQPAVALTGLLAVLVVVAPMTPKAFTARWRRMGHPLGMTVLALVVLVFGLWNSALNQRTIATLKTALATGEVVRGADELTPIIAADPFQPVYHWQQAFLYGLGASEGDLNAAEAGIRAYERFLTLEPYHASSWANLAALRWQIGDEDAAVEAIQRAVELAPRWDIFRRQREIYSGALPFAPAITLETSRWYGDWRFQFLRDIILQQHLPQVGWGTERT